MRAKLSPPRAADSGAKRQKTTVTGNSIGGGSTRGGGGGGRRPPAVVYRAVTALLKLQVDGRSNLPRTRKALSALLKPLCRELAFVSTDGCLGAGAGAEPLAGATAGVSVTSGPPLVRSTIGERLQDPAASAVVSSLGTAQLQQAAAVATLAEDKAIECMVVVGSKSDEGAIITAQYAAYLAAAGAIAAGGEAGAIAGAPASLAWTLVTVSFEAVAAELTKYAAAHDAEVGEGWSYRAIETYAEDAKYPPGFAVGRGPAKPLPSAPQASRRGRSFSYSYSHSNESADFSYGEERLFGAGGRRSPRLPFFVGDAVFDGKSIAATAAAATSGNDAGFQTAGAVQGAAKVVAAALVRRHDRTLRSPPQELPPQTAALLAAALRAETGAPHRSGIRVLAVCPLSRKSAVLDQAAPRELVASDLASFERGGAARRLLDHTALRRGATWRAATAAEAEAVAGRRRVYLRSLAAAPPLGQQPPAAPSDHASHLATPKDAASKLVSLGVVASDRPGPAGAHWAADEVIGAGFASVAPPPAKPAAANAVPPATGDRGASEVLQWGDAGAMRALLKEQFPFGEPEGTVLLPPKPAAGGGSRPGHPGHGRGGGARGNRFHF